MLGQLQDAGNTTTLAHYLDLLAGAGMIVGLRKYSGSRVRQRGSSPKLLALNTALVAATSGLGIDEARGSPDFWGRLVETAIGAHLVNSFVGTGVDVFYWREDGHEVDYVVRSGKGLTAIEVTSGRRKPSLPGVEAFSKLHKMDRALLVGGQGIPLDEFLASPPDRSVK